MHGHVQIQKEEAFTAKSKTEAKSPNKAATGPKEPHWMCHVENSPKGGAEATTAAVTPESVPAKSTQSRGTESEASDRCREILGFSPRPCTA